MNGFEILETVKQFYDRKFIYFNKNNNVTLQALKVENINF